MPAELDGCDFDGSGKVTADDGQALLDYVTGVRTEISSKSCADLDKDGDIDTYDAYLFFSRLSSAAVTVPANGKIHVTIRQRFLVWTATTKRTAVQALMSRVMYLPTR